VVATFAIVTLIGGVGDEHHSIERYQGLARRQPWLGGALAILLLSQLGAPLTTGFYAKFAVLASVVDAGGGALALIALISAAIAAFFYLRWAMALYSNDHLDAARVRVPLATGLVIGFGVAVTIVFGVWPGPLATLAQHATVLFTP
jgi:NADH-quinone oxidoreductase subunit N